MADNSGRDRIRRELDTDADDPGTEVAMIVAEIDERDPTELPTIHECLNGILTDVFDDPPSPDARLQISFVYADYRITIYQDGTAEFVGAQ